MKINFSESSPSQNGQALVEGVVSLVVLFFLCAGAIEVARIWAFKGMLKTAAQEVAIQLSHNTLLLLREGELDFGTQRSDVSRNYEHILKQQMASYLEQLPSIRSHSEGNSVTPSRIALRSYITADLDKSVAADDETKLGVKGFFVSVNACMPLFFGELLTTGKHSSTQPIFDPQDCLGQFGPLGRMFVIKVHVMAYAPVPASAQIYRHGLPEPTELKGVSPAVPDFMGAETGPNNNSFQRANDSFEAGKFPVERVLQEDSRP